ncbi:MAG: Hsp70 family protein [Acidimicrobiales bacterium]
MGDNMSRRMGYQLGIDLGTTYTAAAVHRNGRVEVAALGDRSTVVPSVVFVKDDGGVLTGDAANRRGRSEPERVAREFKRRVGDPAPIIIGGVPYSADVLTARLLRSVVDWVAEREGSYPDAIAITHPANWGAYKLDLLRQAVRHAGFGGYPVTYLTEPQAAAVHYASQERVAPGAVMGAYDLGGGTFDAAVLRRTQDGGFEIIGQPEGIERLGGIDFDAAVLAHVDNSLDGAVSGLDAADPDAVQAVGRLRADAVEAKEQLSSDVEVSIPISVPGLRHDVRLTRGEFENMIRPAVNETITALRRALDSAGVQPHQVQAVLLVGGSSRIPLVGQMVSAALGRPVAVDAHPKHAIAQGAAVAAAEDAGAATAETVTVVHTEEAAPALVAVPPVGRSFVAPPTQAPQPSAKRRPPVVLIAIGAAAAVILAAVGFFVLRDDDDPAAGDTPSGFGAVSDQGDLWIGSTGLGGLVKVNRDDREIVANLPIQNVFDPPVVAEEFVWAVAGGGGIGGPVIFQIDRAEATVVNRIPVPLSAAGEPGGNIEIRPATGGIWARVTQSGTPATVLHVNDDGEIDVEVPTEVSAFSLASDGDRAYVLGFDGVMARVDLDGTVRQSAAPVAAGGLFVAQGEPHVLAEDRIVRVDPEQMTVAEIVDYVIDGSAAALPGFDDLYPDLIVDGTTLYGAVGSEPASFFDIDLETGETELVELPIDGNLVTAIRLAQGDDDTVWAYSRVSGGALARVDVANDDIDAMTVSTEGIGDAQLVAAPDLVGVFESAAAPTLYLLDTEGEIVEELSTFLFPAAPSFAGGIVWLADFIGGTTTPFDTGEAEFGAPLEVAGLAREAAGIAFLPTGTGELLAINPEDPTNPTTLPLPHTGDTVVTDGERVWVDGGNVFMAVDPATLTVTGTVSNTDYLPPVDYPFVANRTVAGAGALWDLTETGVNRIDVTTGQSTPITLIGAPVDVSFEGGFVWVTSADGQVARLDPATGSQVGGIDGEAAGYVEAAGANIYFIEMDGGLVRELLLAGPGGPQTDAIAETFEIGAGLATALTVDDELWVANQSTGTVTRIDFAGLTEEIEVGGRPVGIVGDADGVFVVDQDGGQLVRIDPESGEIQDFDIE